MKNKYVFLIGWIDGSDGACGEETGVTSQTDLIAIYKGEKQGQVTSWEIEAENENEAYERGATKAFLDNWTARDSMTEVILA